MPDFVPVDHQPEFDAEQFVPPFLSDWAKQAAPKDVEILKQTAEPLINAMAAPGNALASTTPITTEQMVKPAADMASMLTLGAGAIPAEANAMRMGIKAYHGSPHDFDAFDLSKIGTGEGAQAYGHGLYFAESEPVAKSYRDALATTPVHPELADASKAYNDAYMAVGKAMSGTKEEFNAAIAARDAAQAKLQRIKAEPLQSNPGRMYEVNINADPEHFLDWDKPLSEQHPVVVDALQKAMRPRQWDEFHPAQAGTAMKQGFIGLDEQIASEKLREAGLPGIKYLDQGSRTSGEGSRNYIVFNDKLIDILKKYGIAGLPAGIAATQTQPSQDDMVNAIRGQ